MGRRGSKKEVVGNRPERPERPDPEEGQPFESRVFLSEIPASIAEPSSPKRKAKQPRRARLTQDFIDRLGPEGEAYTVWDTKLTGLGVRVGKKGKATLFVKISRPNRRSVWLPTKTTCLDEASLRYHEFLIKYGRGGTLPVRQSENIWQDVADRFLKEQTSGLEPNTVSSYKSALKLLNIAFKDRPVTAITYLDVRNFYEGLSDRPRQANVALALSRRVFAACKSVWKFLPPEVANPVDAAKESGMKIYPNETRDVPLSDEHFERLGSALGEMEDRGRESPFPIGAVRLLIFTGQRLKMILNLKWEDIDLTHKTIRFKSHKTKKKVGTVKAPLNEPALEVLLSIPRLEGNPYVFPGHKPGQPIKDIRKFWGRMVTLAGLESVLDANEDETNLRRHDLRHAHGNEAADLQFSLQTVAALLNHRGTSTTERYSKVTRDPALAASNTVSKSLKSKLGAKK